MAKKNIEKKEQTTKKVEVKSFTKEAEVVDFNNDVVDSNVEQEEEFDAEKLIEEFSDAAKKIDEKITNTTTQDELKETLEGELKRVEDVEKKVMEEIEKEESKLNDEQKKLLDKMTGNNKFTNIWNGVSEGWFN